MIPTLRNSSSDKEIKFASSSNAPADMYVNNVFCKDLLKEKI